VNPVRDIFVFNFWAAGIIFGADFVNFSN